MLNVALALMVFLLVSQAYSQNIETQNVTAPVQVLEASSDEKMEALQQQLLLLQAQVKELHQQKPQQSEYQAPAVPVAPVVAPVSVPQAVASVSVVPAKEKDSIAEFEGDLYKHLRKRKQSLSWRYSHGYEKHKLTASNSPNATTVDGNRTEYEFEYAVNLSFIEGGVRIVGMRSEDNDGDETLQSDFAVVGRFNFVENRPGHDFVPYLAGYLGGVRIKYTASPSYTLDGGYAGLGLGFNWFPFSEIFALNLELSHYSAGLESDTYPKVQTDSINTRLNVGWRIYF